MQSDCTCCICGTAFHIVFWDARSHNYHKAEVLQVLLWAAWCFCSVVYYCVISSTYGLYHCSLLDIMNFDWIQHIGGGDGRTRGVMAPLLWDNVCKKVRDTLVEQSGSGYSNRAVTVFREAV